VTEENGLGIAVQTRGDVDQIEGCGYRFEFAGTFEFVDEAPKAEAFDIGARQRERSQAR
jgi:hypothetical protein